MVNLASFSLLHTPPGDVTVRRLLDFFESAPCLRKVRLSFATPTSGAQSGPTGVMGVSGGDAYIWWFGFPLA